MLVLDNRYELGQIVYLITDVEQMARVVTNIKVLPNCLLSYQLSCGYECSDHYEMEISDTINVEK